MAVTSVQSATHNTTSAVASDTVTLNGVAVGSTIVVAAVGNAAGGYTLGASDNNSATYSSVALAQNGFLVAQVWYTTNATGGNTTITITVTGTNAVLSLVAVEYANVDNSNPAADHRTSTASSTSSFGLTALTGSDTSTRVFAIAGNPTSSGTITGTSGNWTEQGKVSNVAGANNMEAEDDWIATDAPSWTSGSSTNWAGVSFALQSQYDPVPSVRKVTRSMLQYLGFFDSENEMSEDDSGLS